ncbi:MAG: TRAP transporter fused permease subunit, partial [Gammaproteobacteria bacterium]|nr:TRAP transporter fused permease subunit [Gammaproteobacteria bacterium]
MHASKPADASAPGTTMRDVQRLLDSETGARGQKGGAAVVLLVVPLLWSLFQLWIASPLPFALNFGVFNSTEARAIHLAFALFLAFSAFPMFKGRVSPRVPWYDWLLALAGAYSAAYLYIFQHELATRSGAPVLQDLVVAGVGVVLLLEATRRALGLPLTVVALVFLVYTFAGPYMPDVIDHKGASFSKVASHQWLTAEGVFGVALGVSTSFVFLFVLFGAMLEKAGAGGYFIRLAYALLGHMRGGPAKAAVVSSGLSGLISGSSIANVVTTGTFTIPLMKRVGFSPVKAGAVEVAASTNGQLTPPIMGAAAFLMVEYVGISYLEVIKHAILPAFISYVALFYIVHLEACKLGMQGLPRAHVPTLAQRLLSWGTLLIGLMILTLVIYYGVGWLKVWLGEYATWVLAGLLVLVYVVTLKATARYVPDDPHAEPELDVLPRPGPTLKSGLHYLLPVVLMLWCLTVERFSPELSAFWATVFLGGIMVTQRP